MILGNRSDGWNVSERITDLNEMQQIIMKFAHSLWDDDGDCLTEFHFGCNADRIEWDDQDFSDMDIAPAEIVSFDVLELTDGLCSALTPEAIHRLIFSGPHREVVVGALLTALSCERDRVSQMASSHDHLADIRNQLLIARMGIFASWQAALAAHNVIVDQGIVTFAARSGA